MPGRSAITALHTMTEHDDDMLEKVTERLERRLAEECGALRVEIVAGNGSLRAEMVQGFGALRAEMIDRNTALLKWGLLYAVTQIGAVAGLFALFR